LSLSVHFLPFKLGIHKCRVYFLDSGVGEFVGDIVCTVTAPPPIESLKWSVEEGTSLDREIIINPKNSAIIKARDTLRLLETPKHRRGDTTVCPSFPSSEVTPFKVNISSPFYSSPETVLVDLSSSEKQVNPSKLNVRFMPKGIGIYPCTITIASLSHDVRVYEVEGKARPKSEAVSLEFVVPCRQSSIQDIPITNPTDQDWQMTVDLVGQHFSGPSSILIKAKATTSYPLSFKPTVMCTSKGTLSLTNSSTGEKMVINLQGTSVEPLSEGVIRISCIAREKRAIKINVPILGNPGESIVYKVESDLPFISGSDTLEILPPSLLSNLSKSVGASMVEKRSSGKFEGTMVDLESASPSKTAVATPKAGQLTGEYELTAYPSSGGNYRGTITFTLPNGQFLWYVIEMNVDQCAPESELNISCVIRKAVVVEITINNPNSVETLEFEVSMNGNGVLGSDTISVPPGESSLYELIYSPVATGDETGSVTFYNPTVGEFWYKLNLHAQKPDPISLPPMISEVGKVKTYDIWLENPIEEDVEVTASSTNDESFKVVPSKYVVDCYIY